MTELTSITITAADEQWLATFSHKLIHDKLAACAKIIPSIRSIYVWEGKVEDETEALLTLHTRVEHVSRIIERTKAEHPYDEPQVVSSAIAECSEGYRQWVIDSTTL